MRKSAVGAAKPFLESGTTADQRYATYILQGHLLDSLSSLADLFPDNRFGKKPRRYFEKYSELYSSMRMKAHMPSVYASMVPSVVGIEMVRELESLLLTIADNLLGSLEEQEEWRLRWEGISE